MSQSGKIVVGVHLMEKMINGKTMDIIWLIVMLIGLGLGRFVEAVSDGEFYIGLILWYYVARTLSDWDNLD